MPERADPTSVPSITAKQPRAIHSALTVLEAVAAIGPGVTARELSFSLGLPRATTYRLLNLLVQDEYLVRTPDLAGFALGAKVATLAAAAAPVRLPRAALSVIDSTRRALRGGVHVVLYTDGRIIVADEDRDFPFSDEIALARRPERFAVGMLRAIDTADAAPTAVADLRRWGVVRQVGAPTGGAGCLAAPIRDADGRIAGAIAFSGPRHRVDAPDAAAAVLVDAAQALGPLLT